MYKLIIATFAFLMMVSCTKERPTQFAQGQGENLLSISSYNGKTFTITTGAPIEGQAMAFSKAQNIDINSKSLGQNTFSVVSYEVDDALGKKLLGDTPIVGKANTTYKGLIKVEQHYVKVYKVAKAVDLPLNEKTYAVKLSSDELAVPLIGYPITSLVSIDRLRNQFGESSSTQIEKSEPTLAGATHFRLDMSRGEIFEAVVKTDVLPASYFTGDWYFTETLTAAAEEQSSQLGFTGGYDQTLTPSTRVKFLTNENSLKIVNLNIDERLTKKADVNFKTAVTIPVSWKSYKISGNGQGMAEQEDLKIHWSKRNLIQIDFDKTRSTLSNGNSRLVALEVKDNYLSFALEDSNGLRVRYSFLRAAKRNYQAKILFKDDKRQFGFFETTKDIVNNYEISRQEDVEKNTFISRFNPRAGKVVFNFTKTTPQWIRPYVQEAVSYWDQAFKAAGVENLDIVLDGTKDVELGDLRYNAINIIENLTASNLFGFGPSVTDPFSGEIISATTNVHLTPIREALIAEVKTFIKMKTGQLDETGSIGISYLLGVLEDVITKQSNNGMDVISDIFPAGKKMKVFLPSKQQTNKYLLQNIDFRNRTAQNAREFDIAIASGNIHADIIEQCSDVLDYIKELNNSGATHNEKENSILDSCSRKLVVTKFMGTLVHEMGHNFGLRHNFMASNDVKNFMSTEKTQTKHQVRSSSVMEYSSFNEDRLVKPGPYDIAAIKFGYADAISLKDGKTLLLNTGKTIAQNLKSQNTTAKTFKFCTDEDVYYAVDPMCQRHDAGVTPLEVVKNIIANYQASVTLYNHRGDSLRAIDPAILQIYRGNAYFLPLLRFYEEWRSGVARYLGQDDQYLERYSAQEFAAIIQRMSKDPEYATFVQQYKPTADAIFNFFFELATIDNKYCVLEAKDGSGLKLDELEKIREQLYFSKKKSVTSCADANTSGFWADKNMSLLTEVGTFMNSLRFDLSDKSAAEPLDIIGSLGDRMNANLSLTDRFSQGYDTRSRGFFPSMMDEPIYRATVENYLQHRIAAGLPGALISRDLPNADKNLKDYLSQVSFPVFSTEKELNTSFFGLYQLGLEIPGKPAASQERKSLFNTVYIPTSQQSSLEDAVDYIATPSGFFAVMDSNSKGALALIQAYKETLAMKQSILIDSKNSDVEKTIQLLSNALPSSSELKSMTVGQLIERLSTSSDEIIALSKKKNSSINILLGDIMPVFQLSLQLEKILSSEDPTQKEQVAQLQNENFLNFLQQQTGSTYFPTSDTLAAEVERSNKRALFYKDNRNELDAKIDLITSVFKVILSN